MEEGIVFMKSIVTNLTNRLARTTRHQPRITGSGCDNTAYAQPFSAKGWPNGTTLGKGVIASLFFFTLLVGSGSVIGQEEKSTKTPPPLRVDIPSKMSLIHVGSNDSFNPTTSGVEAGRLLLEALENKEPASAEKAIEIYDAIVPRENYGGEYTALQWFASILVTPEAERQKSLTTPFVDEFYHFFADNDFATLQEYLKRKYNLKSIGDEETRAGQERKAVLEDTLLFNNPMREKWEHTSEILKLVKLDKGDSIADVGSGPGYYTHRFSEMVGPEGKVFAIDTVKEHLDYIARLEQKLGMANVVPVHVDGLTIGIPGEKVNAVFLCSLYHNIYGMATLADRESFLESIKAALKDDGVLYLIDNGLVEPGLLPYHGPYVARELVINQLKFYNFELVEQHDPVPQRYMLVFKKKPGDNSEATVEEPKEPKRDERPFAPSIAPKSS